MNFHVGQKVVCMDASPFLRPHNLVAGNIYVIDGFDPETEPGTTGILIAGFDHPTGLDGRLIGFHPRRFRPVIEKKTDISIFTRMLTSAPRVKENSP